MMLSGNAICVSDYLVLDTRLDNVKPTKLVAKMDAASVIRFYCIAKTKKPNNQKESYTKGEPANNADTVLTAN